MGEYSKEQRLIVLTSETVPGWGGGQGVEVVGRVLSSCENPSYLDNGFNSPQGFVIAASGYGMVDQG